MSETSWRLQRFVIYQRLALVIVERLLLPRQVGDLPDPDPAFEKPMCGLGREHEELPELEFPRARLDLVHQRFAITFAAEVRLHGERGQFAQLVLGERVQRRAADDVAV